MDDGSMEDFGRNDVMLLPSGHDAWTVGEEPCVFIEHRVEEPTNLRRLNLPVRPSPE
jgi:hypothetical protein